MLSRRQALQRTAALIGVSLSPSLLNTALAQISRDPEATPDFLSPARFATAAALAEALLPKTDTPGAIDVGVPQFIDQSYGRFMSAGERENLERFLDHAGAASAAELSLAQQQQLLLDYGQAEPGMTEPLREFRRIVMMAFYTSEDVSKNLLIYDPVPGRLDADIPLADVGGRAWAL